MSRESPKWTDIAIVILTVGIVLAAVIQTVIFKRQWREMSDAGKQTDQMLGLVRQQVEKMGQQVTDTHDIALQSGRQAQAAKEASDTARLALDASSRAWIAPNSVYFTSEVAKHAPLTFVVQYRNTGKSPAFGVHPVYKIEQVPVSKFDDNTFNVFIETTDLCKNLKLAPGADVVYPGLPDPYELFFATHVPDWVGDDVIEGRNAIVLRMCFAYGTMQRLHHTSFCYFFRAGISPANKHMNICTAGNHAD